MIFSLLFVIIALALGVVSATPLCRTKGDRVTARLGLVFIILMAFSIPFAIGIDEHMMFEERAALVEKIENSDTIDITLIDDCESFDKILQLRKDTADNIVFGFKLIGISYEEIDFINISDYIEINKK